MVVAGSSENLAQLGLELGLSLAIVTVKSQHGRPRETRKPENNVCVNGLHLARNFLCKRLLQEK
jgi:hypothetical protein